MLIILPVSFTAVYAVMFSIHLFIFHLNLYCILILLPVCEITTPYLPSGGLKVCLNCVTWLSFRCVNVQYVCDCTVKSVVGDH